MGTKFGSSFQDQYILHSFLFDLGKKEKGEIHRRNLKREWGGFLFIYYMPSILKYTDLGLITYKFII